MALGSEFIEAHVARWEQRLRSGFYPHREKWPRRLFHHGPIENISSILNSGVLRSRADPKNPKKKDVAGAGVIDARIAAHKFVRLYFRPRTPTQFHIEGIRKANECQYGEHAHAAVLVMLVFDAPSVLCLPGTKFSDRNMQLANVPILETEEEFAQIPFDKVFSEGGTGGDRSYIEHRCAEVLAESPLQIEKCLRWIYCRSEAERLFLINELALSGLPWVDKIVVSDDLKVFEKKYAFVDGVWIGSDGLTFRISPRADRGMIDLQVQAWAQNKQKVIDFHNKEMLAVPENATRWIIPATLPDGQYRIAIRLEGQRAFEAHMTVGDVLF